MTALAFLLNSNCFFSLQEDEKFLTDLFMQLTDEDTSEERRKDLVSNSRLTQAYSEQHSKFHEHILFDSHADHFMYLITKIKNGSWRVQRLRPKLEWFMIFNYAFIKMYTIYVWYGSTCTVDSINAPSLQQLYFYLSVGEFCPGHQPIHLLWGGSL